MTIGWKNEDGNPASISNDQRNDDPPAPNDVLNHLSRVDLELPAHTLKAALGQDVAKGLAELQGSVYSWVKST